MRFIIAAFLLTSFAGQAKSKEKPVWGKIICTAVAKDAGVTFAKDNPFLDNWDFENEPISQPPPYVEPKGTLDCTLPVFATPSTNEDGSEAYQLEVRIEHAPYKVGKCKITYYDNSRTRTFPAYGDGDGYIGLVPGGNDFDVTFRDVYQTRFFDDSFLGIDIGLDPQILWMGESQDERPHVPILSQCHLEIGSDNG